MGKKNDTHLVIDADAFSTAGKLIGGGLLVILGAVGVATEGRLNGVSQQQLEIVVQRQEIDRLALRSLQDRLYRLENSCSVYQEARSSGWDQQKGDR